MYADYHAVTEDDIARVAHTYLRENELRLAVVGPSGEADELAELLRL